MSPSTCAVGFCNYKIEEGRGVRYYDVPAVDSFRGSEQMMLRGEIEMALTAIPPRSPELFKESCMPLKLVPFAAKKYPIATAGLTLADLEMFPLIIRDNRDNRGTTETVLMRLRD